MSRAGFVPALVPMPKPRPPSVRSVRAPDALAVLRAWIATFDEGTRERGQEYWEHGHVHDVRATADHFVQAVVQGQEPYELTLFYTRGKWSSTCACPVRVQCKHAYAAARAWITTVESEGDAPRPAVVPPAPLPPPMAARPRKKTFREEWAPILATKLGRPLTEAEGNQLAQLSALFAEFANDRHTLFPGRLERHGFRYTPPRGATLYDLAFAGWWDRAHPPADPWALWQYLAHHYETTGEPIPEVFRPMTDTRAVRAAIEEQSVQQELAVWRRALASADEMTAAARPNPAAGLAGLRARLLIDGGLRIETRTSPKLPWRAPTQKLLRDLGGARPSDFEHLTPAEAALGNALAAELRANLNQPAREGLDPPMAAALLRTTAARPAICLPNEAPFVLESEPLQPQAMMSAQGPDRLDLRLVTPDGRDATEARLIAPHPEPIYLFDGRVWRGPPALPARTLPTAGLNDPKIMMRLRAAGLRLPSSLELKVRRVTLRPVLRCWVTEPESEYHAAFFHAQLLATSDHPPCTQHWCGGGGWQWTKGGAPPARSSDDPVLEFDLGVAHTAAARLTDFKVTWNSFENTWTRYATKTFPEDFIAWHASLPPGLAVEASPQLAGLLGPPLRAHVEFSAAPSDGAQRDWFDLTVALRVEDHTLTAAEIALLLKARGKWVSLPGTGWRRIELADGAAGEPAAAALDRLGLGAADVLATGKPATHKLHALQLAAEAASLESRDAKLAAALRSRVTALAAVVPPEVPAELRATLRPYQREGFQFLTHLASLGFGGVLADDMGLGKTVQALAWLLHLAAEPRAGGAPLRVLVVCPKSVTHGWLVETERFAPTLHAVAFNPLRLGSAASGSQPSAPGPQLLVANYTQLRLNAAWFQQQSWDAVVLDEGQFIKNPGSQVAATARSLPSRHRLVLTGTPIENRLTDLWSLFAFAQPGLLGTQTAFRRQYDESDPAALSRLHRRVRHFLLRRTKAQAAPDLPPRTEDEIVVELEGEQRKLYDAELKRARAQLLGIATDRALDSVRFNILASLLRLRQICCHPGLIDPAHRHLPSAKLDALLERLEELRDEGHQVLVFSQFVEMLEIIRVRLHSSGIGHLMLTGATENRAELVDEFQRDKTKTVFLLSLKAAGFGLNLTAASYVILYDPWWNPAVEAQAIDRTHRIGQTQPVVAYRLLAEGTVEEKIRALQKEKAALAAAVVQEESLASILDLDSLRRVLA